MKNFVETPEERFNKVDAVTADDIARVAADVFDIKKATLAIIGPYKDEKGFYNLLG